MRTNPITLITVLLFLAFNLKAQDSTHFSILLQSGSFIPPKNISVESIAALEQKAPLMMGKKQLVIQFETIPSETEKKILAASGIELLEYIPNNAYTAAISGNISIAALDKVKARSIFSLSPLQKMDQHLSAGNFPDWAVKTAGAIDVLVSFAKSFSIEGVKQVLQQKNIDIISSKFQDYHTLHLRIAVQRLEELAALPIVTYIQAIDGEEKSLNRNSLANSRASVLSGSTGIGRNLKGEDITIGVGDEGDIQHVDFTGRTINRNPGQEVFHSNHVSGIAAGAGIRVENLTGHAPKATIVSQLFSGIIDNAPAYVADHQMVITNNSWGVIGECSYHGIYDFYSSVIDQQAFTLPNLQHVFAAGNSGAGTCAPYLPNYRTVFGAHQSAKNVITVGNTAADDVIYFSSSRGPVRDGRIKPEVVAQGAAVLSASFGNGYQFAWGTSQAAPAVSGSLALLYQRYKQLNGNSNPQNGLMKALLCNTADDKGNAGPDYTYGFGRINTLRAVEVLENNRYATGTIATGGANSFNITVPANIATLKVMLYWNDPAATLMSSKALVNNLDLTVTTTSPTATYNPLILNINPANVNSLAVPGVDTLNNIEQVTINSPVAGGTYTINVTGTSVPVGGSQQYFVVYDFVPISTTLTYPTGGEKLMPGESVLINWDSYGGTAETFDLEYSTNNGGSWSPIATGIAADQRQLVWTVPATTTKDALVKLTKNVALQISTSANFTVISAPAVSLSPDNEQCEGYIKIVWPTVTDATGYEVMKLAGTEMQSTAILPNSISEYTFSGLSKDTLYWVTVRALFNGSPGRRGTAIARQPNTGNCENAISNNDIKADDIISPSLSGRLNTSTALSATTPLTIRVKNLDDVTSTAELTFSYSINGGGTITDLPVTPTINAGATYDYTFASPINLAAAGAYSIQITVVRTGGDPVTVNNTITKVFKQLNNALIILPFTDDLETAANETVKTAQIGLIGLDRYDFKNSNAAGRLRTFMNSGMSFSGTKAITLDAENYVAAGNIDSLTGTFNLTGLNANSNDIRLDFRYKNHGQTANAANKLWIRGTDQDNWIEAYDMAANQNDVDGTYKLSASIEVSDLLRNASPVQNFSSSFQARWGQFGSYSAADNSGYSGYTIDDIKLYEVVNDLYLVSIDTPIVNSCNLSDTTPIKITIRNNSENAIPPLTSIPVRYRINNGTWVNETITTGIAANSSYQYTFSDSANLTAIGNYFIEAEVDYPSDNYHTNNTLSKTISNTSAITVTNTAPYLQGFESDNGSWYASGKNKSWEYGTPSSYKINRAANGSKAWKTRNSGNYNDSENSYLYSPCFDISMLTNPTLSMSIALDLEDCGGALCDGAYVEYSTNGSTWSRLGANGQGTNWYNKTYAGNNLWSAQNYTRWHVATLPLSLLPAPQSQYTRLQFRFVVASDPLVTREGIAIDDIHIYSNPYGIYDVTGASPIVNMPVVNNNSWVNFVESGTNKIIASVNPDGQDLGSTNVQSFIYGGSVRTNSNQYYHNRNITIKPTNTILGDSCSVRFYFLDSETEALLNATGCATCYKPAMAYELGVSKYSDPDDTYEDGVVENGLAGIWLFINSAKVQKVPFDKGYYAQFRVKDFSEFWLNNGGLNGDRPLPLQLTSFTAKKTVNNKDVLTEWVTASEFNINRFEVEVARSQQEYLRNEFVKIGVVNSAGNSSTDKQYQFTDVEDNKSGIRYYRLKIIENDGKFSYSAIRSVLFVNDNIWTIQPNPSTGLFYLGMQATNGQLIAITITDMSGRLVQQQQVISSGFVQKIPINLEESKFAKGFYLLEATTERGVKQQFKLLKQ